MNYTVTYSEKARLDLQAYMNILLMDCLRLIQRRNRLE